MDTALKLVDDLYTLRDTFFITHTAADAPRKHAIIAARLSDVLPNIRSLAGSFVVASITCLGV